MRLSPLKQNSNGFIENWNDNSFRSSLVDQITFNFCKKVRPQRLSPYFCSLWHLVRTEYSSSFSEKCYFNCSSCGSSFRHLSLVSYPLLVHVSLYVLCVCVEGCVCVLCVYLQKTPLLYAKELADRACNIFFHCQTWFVLSSTILLGFLCLSRQDLVPEIWQRLLVSLP